MIFDSFILTYIEKHITHPIQKKFGWTNYTLVRWIQIFVLIMIILLLFKILPHDTVLITALNSDYVYSVILLFLFTYFPTFIYMILYGFEKTERIRLDAVQSGYSNPCKKMLIWQFIRLNLFLECIVTLFALSTLIQIDDYRMSVLYTAILVFTFYASAILYCLDPISKKCYDF